jgi:DUF4097 and DUF4098 domain-containing protein YvlB
MIAAAFFIAATIVAQAPARETRAPQTDETVSVAKGTRLVVDNFAGEVIVRTWDRDAIRVQARHRAQAKVTINPTASVVTIRSNSGSVGSVDYEITAPAWMPMRISGTYNFVTVEGAQGEVIAETTRGDVVIKGGTTITAKSIQGEVIVEGARGRVTASSVNEGVRIADTSGDITAETTNGDIRMTNVKSANVEIATINGNIVYDGAPAERGRYRFATHNGNIVVYVPETASVAFTVRTYNGSFQSAIPLNGPPRSEVRQGRRHTYTLGTGSAEMEMESFGGSIRVRRPGTAPTSTPKEKEKDRR